MTSGKPHILLLSDFTVQNFGACLRKAIPGCKVALSPFNQLQSILSDPKHNLWQETYDLVIVWASPQAVAPSFPAHASLTETRNFSGLLLQSPAIRSRLLVIDFAMDLHRFFGFAGETELQHLMEMNLLLRKELTASGHTVISSLPWMAASGSNAFHPSLWYLSKTPFHISVFRKAADTIRSYWQGWTGKSRKLLLLDLDDTLWGGIVGDDGWQQLQLGGHDGAGEAFADFQRGIRQLTEQGVILGIVSKNDEAVALEAIRLHPEMILKETDFAGWRINWDDKASNIADLTAQLNLGLDSVVFLDDNPAERDRVRQALPQVLVPDLPADKMEYPRFLMLLDCFNFPALTKEDKERTALYRQENERRSEQQQFTSAEEWLASLDMQLKVAPLGEDNLARAAQLLNKTNQMNLRTRRMSETELKTWSGQPGHFFYTVTVSDKFGNAGLTGLISFSLKQDTAWVEDFVLSCRVMGRKVEEAMLGWLLQRAKENGAKQIIAELLPTEKNKPCREFFDRSGWQNDRQQYSYATHETYPMPAHIRWI